MTLSFFVSFFNMKKPERNTLMDLDWLFSLKQLFIKDICKEVSQCAVRGLFLQFCCLINVLTRPLWENNCLHNAQVETHVYTQTNRYRHSHKYMQAHTWIMYSDRNLHHYSCTSKSIVSFFHSL